MGGRASGNAGAAVKAVLEIAVIVDIFPEILG
jgi:hypothetical protein